MVPDRFYRKDNRGLVELQGEEVRRPERPGLIRGFRIIQRYVKRRGVNTSADAFGIPAHGVLLRRCVSTGIVNVAVIVKSKMPMIPR